MIYNVLNKTVVVAVIQRIFLNYTKLYIFTNNKDSSCYTFKETVLDISKLKTTRVFNFCSR